MDDFKHLFSNHTIYFSCPIVDVYWVWLQSVMEMRHSSGHNLFIYFKADCDALGTSCMCEQNTETGFWIQNCIIGVWSVKSEYSSIKCRFLRFGIFYFCFKPSVFKRGSSVLKRVLYHLDAGGLLNHELMCSAKIILSLSDTNNTYGFFLSLYLLLQYLFFPPVFLGDLIKAQSVYPQLWSAVLMCLLSFFFLHQSWWQYSLV